MPLVSQVGLLLLGRSCSAWPSQHTGVSRGAPDCPAASIAAAAEAWSTKYGAAVRLVFMSMRIHLYPSGLVPGVTCEEIDCNCQPDVVGTLVHFIPLGIPEL